MSEIDDYFNTPKRRPHAFMRMAAWQQGDACALCGWDKADSIHKVGEQTVLRDDEGAEADG